MKALAATALAALLLAGCSGSDAPRSPLEESCARQANDDPVVADMIRKGAGTQQYAWDNEQRLKQAKQDATLRCLRARGVIPMGGVERPRP